MKNRVRLVLGTIAIAALVFGMTALLPGPHPAASGAGPVQVSMKILTGKMDGKSGWPKFEPAKLSLPAHTLVQVTLRDYDDGNADIPAGYNRVKGTVGGDVRVIKGTPATITPNEGVAVREVPVKDVAHTFTMAANGLNLNVPIPVSSTVVFSFMTPGPGTYSWQCLSLCGTDPNGAGGPMVTKGWMRGSIIVK